MTRSSDSQSFGSVLEAVLGKCVLTQRQLAIRVGVDTGHIGKILKTKVKQPRIELCIKIIEVLEAEGADVSALQAFVQPVEAKKLPIAENLAPGALQSETKTAIDPEFVGRAETIERLWKLEKAGAKLIEIQAAGGVGKTTVAEEFAERLQQEGEFEAFIPIKVCLRQEDAMTAEALLEELFRGLEEEGSRDFNTALVRLDKVLRRRRVLILLDNLEPTLDGDGRFCPKLRRYADIFQLLSSRGVRSLTLVTTRECVLEPSATFKRFPLEMLAIEAWEEYFDSQEISISSSVLEQVHRAYGGNAKAMTTLCGEAENDYDSDFDRFWEQYGEDLPISFELKVLICEQFDRLKYTNLWAYKLLVRMGCYRYQDVPKIEEAGVSALLWDMDDGSECRQIVESLRKRALVEESRRKFSLHPVVREESLIRLQQDLSLLKESNLRAAIYLDTISTVLKNVEDVTTAFESHRHYMKADRCDLALEVIIKQRNNSPFDRLGYFLWQFGLISKTRQDLMNLIKEVMDESQKCNYMSIYQVMHLISDMHWMSGMIKEAITNCLNSLEYIHEIMSNFEEKEINIQYFSNDILNCEIYDSELGRLVAGHHLCLALCYLSLNELNSCEVHANQSLPLLFGMNREHNIPVLFGIKGIIFARENHKDRARESLTKALDIQLKLSDKREFWSQTYCYLFTAETAILLDEFLLAAQLIDEAENISKKSKFKQGIGKSLLLKAELHRKLKEYGKAYQFIGKAIRVLELIDARSDLSEAYFHAALVYRDIGDSLLAQQTLEKSHEIYRAMDAPLQIERTTKIFNT